MSYQEKRKEYKNLVEKAFENLYRTIYYPDMVTMDFKEFPNDFKFSCTDGCHMLIFNSIKPQTTLIIYKDTEECEIWVDVPNDNIFSTRLSKRTKISGFDTALEYIMKRVEEIVNK